MTNRFGATKMRISNRALTGLGIILLYCVLATGADAITRTVSQSFDAPQLFCFSGGLVALFSFVALKFGKEYRTGSNISLKPQRIGALAMRSVCFIVSSVFYFLAFRSLPFAEVFVFIALVPIFAALLSGPILREYVPWKSWIALLAGVCGMLLLYPDGISDLTMPHFYAVMGAFSGAGAMVLARHISRYDKNVLLQVLYPNLALCIVMTAILPFVYKPMGLTDFANIAGYAGLLFLARWVLVLGLTRMKAHVVTLLMNLQFVVMIGAGALFFAETPSFNLILGASIIVFAGIYLLVEPALPQTEAGLEPAN